MLSSAVLKGVQLAELDEATTHPDIRRTILQFRKRCEGIRLGLDKAVALRGLGDVHQFVLERDPAVHRLFLVADGVLPPQLPPADDRETKGHTAGKPRVWETRSRSASARRLVT